MRFVAKWGCCHNVNVFIEQALTPSLPQPVNFPGCMMHGCACKQNIVRSYNTYFQCYAFWWKSFHLPVRRRRQKDLRVSNFAPLLVLFKWRRGREGVNWPKIRLKHCSSTPSELRSCVKVEAAVLGSTSQISLRFLWTTQLNWADSRPIQILWPSGDGVLVAGWVLLYS